MLFITLEYGYLHRIVSEPNQQGAILFGERYGIFCKGPVHKLNLFLNLKKVKLLT